MEEVTSEKLSMDRDPLLVEFRSNGEWQPYGIFHDAREGINWINEQNKKDNDITYRGCLVPILSNATESIELDLSDSTIAELAMDANSKNITLNHLIQNILRDK